jgi:N-acetylglucosamine kinase-like BadF-type ATPase
MSTVAIGVDVGGTKTHLAALDDSGRRRDVIIASSEWRRGELFGEPDNLRRLASWVKSTAQPSDLTPMVMGIRDCDSPTEITDATARLQAALGQYVRVENDADLLGPAAGLEESIALVVGTGAIVSGRRASGERVTADGYGWLLGDWGSAPTLIRCALQRLLTSYDVDDHPDLILAGYLFAHFGAHDPVTLASLATAQPSASLWGDAAPLLFAALSEGSPIAREVIDISATKIATGIESVHRRGAAGIDVIAAGGVITSQAALQEAVRRELATAVPQLRLSVLTVPPVDGALRLASTW